MSSRVESKELKFASPLGDLSAAIHLKAAVSTSPPTYDEIKSFVLSREKTLKFYKAGHAESWHFAMELFNQAQQRGFKSEYVEVLLESTKWRLPLRKHALVRFFTRDRGELFVDAAPVYKRDFEISYSPRFVWVKEGDELFMTDVEKAPEWFTGNKSVFSQYHDKELSAKAQDVSPVEKAALIAELAELALRAQEHDRKRAELGPQDYKAVSEFNQNISKLRAERDLLEEKERELKRRESLAKVEAPNAAVLGDYKVKSLKVIFP